MKAPHHKQVRLVFEPSRFSTDQLIKVYEELDPIKSRQTSQPTDPQADQDSILKENPHES